MGSNVSFPGGTIIYIRNGPQYSIDQINWTSFEVKLTITNTDTSLGFVKVYFQNNMEFNNNVAFQCNSDYIQFGNESLNEDGNRTTINLFVPGWEGLVINGSSSQNGFNNITIYNLNINAPEVSLLNINALKANLSRGKGWIGQDYFGKGASNNYIINCSSNGSIGDGAGIGDGGGGILGQYAGSYTINPLRIIGCSSSGIISQFSGGIVGKYAATNGSIICSQCFSTGIIENSAGGIFGDYAGSSNGVIEANKCYSTGLIDVSSGGIFGRYAGDSMGNISAINCYSRGNIAFDAGGIYGISAASNNGITLAQNCYSFGTITTSGNGIYGTGQSGGATLTQCYSANNNWSDASANSNLTGEPAINSNVGNTWVRIGGINQPYELVDFGYSPYLILIINNNTLIQSYSQTIDAGLSTNAAIKNDPSGNYEIIQIIGGDESSHSLITINGNTGAITAPSTVLSGVYTIYLRSVGSYNITIFELTVTNGFSPVVEMIPPCCQPSCTQFNQTTNNSQEKIAIKRSGIAIASDVDSTYVAINQARKSNVVEPIFNSYRDYMTYIMSKYR